jgi:hypothetical protein
MALVKGKILELAEIILLYLLIVERISKQEFYILTELMQVTANPEMQASVSIT